MIRKVTLLILFLLLGACQPQSQRSGEKPVVKVGYFPNVTHSQALIGFARNDFQTALGESVSIKPVTFNAGPSVVEALFAGELDISYVGPNPAINGYLRSKGEALRIVAGATSGGASLVVRPHAGIKGVKDLRGKRIASPQLGNTQDVALRNYLESNGLQTREKGGDVEVLPMPNPQIIDLFKQGEIQGAWVPEPWATRLVLECGGELLVDERTLWPQGAFVTAHIIVRTTFLKTHPELVKKFLEAHVNITQWSLANPTDARNLVNTQLKHLTGKALDVATLAQAWARMQPTWDPLAASLVASAQAAHKLGFLKEAPVLRGIYSLDLLNEVLEARGVPKISAEVS